MSTKSVLLSVRVGMEDAEYISRLDIPGATTPSEKLRSVISSARSRAEGSGSFEDGLQGVQEIVGSARIRLRRHDAAIGNSSEMVRKSVDFASEVIALFVSGVPAESEVSAGESLARLEQQTAEKSIQFVEEVLRMAITEKANCYDPGVIRQKVDRPLELLSVLKALLNEK